jgi:transposase-like protein
MKAEYGENLEFRRETAHRDAEERVRADRFAPFADDNAALDLIEESRWTGGVTCPRCGGGSCKRVHSQTIRELYKCSECTYLFNSRSNTIFHGSKLPASKLIRALCVFDAAGTQADAALMVQLLDVTDQTARNLLRRFAAVGRDNSYLVHDECAYGNGAKPEIDESMDTEWFAIEYLAGRKLAIAPQLFARRLHRALAVRFERG